jgi:predicted phage terminase large subunit-like protein
VQTTEDPNDLAAAIATPALMGQHLGERLLGMPYYVYPWVQFLERKVLSTILQPGRKIIIVSVPPQNGKTTYFGLLLPLWYLGMNPYHQVMFISYNEEQAGKWGLKTRDAMKRFGPELFGERLHPDSDAQSDWKMSNGFGGMMAVGWKGGITGNPGHIIIADDLLKGDEDAGSPAVKGKIFNEVQNSMMSRFQNNTKMFMIATRWAEDDPSGRLMELAERPEYRGIPIETINIKAVAEPTYEERQEVAAEVLAPYSREELAEMGETARIALINEALEDWTDFLGRSEGEALDGQFDQDYYDERHATVDSHGWFSLYQGEPTVREGGMFPMDRWNLYTPEQLPDIVKRVRVWDLAASEGKGDWTTGTLMGRGSDGHFYVLDRERGRWATDVVERHVLDAAKRDGYEIPILIEEERNGAGKTVLEAYKRKLVGYHVDKAKAEGSKQSRATPYSNEQRKGNIYLPADKPWLKEWREEHVQADGDRKWPRHDDQIDTGAYAYKFLTEAGDTIFWDPSQLGDIPEHLDEDARVEALAAQRVFA